MLNLQKTAAEELEEDEWLWMDVLWWSLDFRPDALDFL